MQKTKTMKTFLSIITLFYITLHIGSAYGANTYEWTNTLGSSSDDELKAIAIDSSGNTFIAGTHTGSFTGHTHQGEEDIYIQKVDPSGNTIWIKTIGGTGYDMVADIAIDESNNALYLTGAYGSEDADFDPGAGTAILNSGTHTNGYILRLDLDGSFVWIKEIEKCGITKIEIDSNGDIFYAGMYGALQSEASGTQTDFDPSAGSDIRTSTTGDIEPFISKLDASGAYQWTNTLFHANSSDQKMFVSDFRTNTDHIVLIINIGSGQDWDISNPGTQISTIDKDSGTTLGSPTLSVNYFTSCEIDSSGSIYLCGIKTSELTMDPYQLIKTISGKNFIVQKLTSAEIFTQSSGQYEEDWSYEIISNLNNNGSYDIALDSIDNVLIAGDFTGNTNFDSSNNSSQYIGQNDIYILKLTNAGVFDGVLSIGASGHDKAQRILTASNDIYIGGYFSLEFDFNYLDTQQDFKTSNGAKDAFLMKLTFDDGGFIYDQKYHPADINKDWSIDINEITAYGRAWNAGEEWPIPPNPIELNFVTTGEQIWKNGEDYEKQNSTLPSCWIPLP